MKTKGTGPYITAEVSAMRDHKLMDQHCHILKKHFLPKQVKRCFQGIPAEEYHEDDVHEANKQPPVTELLKPTLQNQIKHHMENEHEVILDPKATCWKGISSLLNLRTKHWRHG